MVFVVAFTFYQFHYCDYAFFIYTYAYYTFFLSPTPSLAHIHMLHACLHNMLHTSVDSTSHNNKSAFSYFVSLPLAFFNAAVAAITCLSLTLRFYRYVPYTCNTCSNTKHTCIHIYVDTFVRIGFKCWVAAKKKIKNFAHQKFMLKLTKLFTNLWKTAFARAPLSTHSHPQHPPCCTRCTIFARFPSSSPLLSFPVILVRWLLTATVVIVSKHIFWYCTMLCCVVHIFCNFKIFFFFFIVCFCFTFRCSRWMTWYHFN